MNVIYKRSRPYPSLVADLFCLDELDKPCAYGSIKATTISLLASSIAKFDNAFDLWKPGTTTINGTLFLLDADLGLYQSNKMLTVLCWQSHGFDFYFPKFDWTVEAIKLAKGHIDKQSNRFLIRRL